MRMGHRAFGIILCLLRSGCLRWLDICIYTDASGKGFALAVREGCTELASEVGRVLERTRFKRSCRSIRARSRALRCIAPGVDSESSGSDENEESLARRECRTDFPEAPLQLLEPSMDTGGVRLFSFASCKGRSISFTLLSFMRRTFAPGFRAGFVLSFRWLPSVSDHADEGCRLFDRDCDPGKSLVHVPAQRLTRTSPSRTSDQNCSSPSPMHLGGGQIDLRSRIR